MLTNYHTHSVFCDGKNTPEEVVLSAIEKGFDALGFSGHGYTPYGSAYCMKDTASYVSEIKRLRDKYKAQLQIYVGAEEDMFAPIDRTQFDYIIGSCHYVIANGVYYPVDSSLERLKQCLEAFSGDEMQFAASYYEAFCAYILDRKPDIVGHFDLLTKFDEVDGNRFLGNKEYLELAKRYIRFVASADVIFEVNTGAISRGYRTAPYPHEDLLHILKEHNAKVMLCSDSHQADTLDCWFNEARMLLKDIGFTHVYSFYDNAFQKYAL